MKIDLDPIEAAPDQDLDREPALRPYPAWLRMLIWSACLGVSGLFWWGLFHLGRTLLR